MQQFCDTYRVIVTSSVDDTTVLRYVPCGCLQLMTQHNCDTSITQQYCDTCRVNVAVIARDRRGGIRDIVEPDGTKKSALEVAGTYFRSGADKVSIGSDAVLIAEEYYKTGVKTGR